MTTLRRLARLALASTLPGPMRLLETGRYALRWCLPAPKPECDPYEPAGYVGREGVDLNLPKQLELIASWRQKGYGELYQHLRADRLLNTRKPDDAVPRDEKIDNGFYPTPDAECYASMIVDFRPKRIVEIGSGYSTIVARRTIAYAGLPTHLTVVDPEPRIDVREFADDTLFSRIEDLDVSRLCFDANTMLFIDSSHICRPRGDVALLYCKILPSLPTGAIVHVHDVYIPYDYPTIYDSRFWNEQYVLHALLAHSQRFQVLLATYLLCREHTGLMRDVVSVHIGVRKRYCGGSFWFRTVDSDNRT